jgi:hypothetical protein
MHELIAKSELAPPNPTSSGTSKGRQKGWDLRGEYLEVMHFSGLLQLPYIKIGSGRIKGTGMFY